MSVFQDNKIEGEIVYLRPITIEDTDNIIKWRNSESVRPYFIYQKPFTREGHLEWMEKVINAGKGYQFIICEKDNGRPIGSTYFRDYDKKHNKMEYGMFIGEKTRIGKGIGTEIVKLSLRFGFEELGLHKIYGRIYADNIASIRSSEKGGLLQEAYLKDDVYVNERYRDMVLVGAINPIEFEAEV